MSKLNFPFTFTCPREGSSTVYRANQPDARGEVWVSWREGGLGVSYPVESVERNVEDGDWKIEEEIKPNGVDANGKRILFTLADLKPFMRIDTAYRGDDWIVVPNVQANYEVRQGERLAAGVPVMVRPSGWQDIAFEGGAHKVVAVYAAPDINANLMDPERRGELLWKAKDFAGEEAQRLARRAELEEEIANHVNSINTLSAKLATI